MGDCQRCLVKAFGVHRVGMVLRSDLHFPGYQVLDGVIAASMSKFQLRGFGTVDQCNDLVAQSDSKHSIVSAKLSNQLNDTLHILRISGAIGQE